MWYGEKNTPHAAAAWRMAGACARHVLSRMPEMDEAHRHAFAPHVSSGYAAQQHAQPVHGQHAQPVTRKNPHCRPHPFPGTPVITPVEAMAARGAGSALRTSLPCAVTRPHTAARSEGEMPYQSTCHDKPCARCGTTLTTSMIVRDALCWHEGARLLANAAPYDTGCPSSRVHLCAAFLGNLWTHQRTASRCNRLPLHIGKNVLALGDLRCGSV